VNPSSLQKTKEKGRATQICSLPARWKEPPHLDVGANEKKNKGKKEGAKTGRKVNKEKRTLDPRRKMEPD